MMKRLIIILALLPLISCGQSNTGYNSPGTMEGQPAGAMMWQNVDNAKTSNNSYTHCISYGNISPYFNTSPYLYATNFGFSIPDGASIDGVIVKIEKQGFDYICENESVYDYEIKLIVDGSVVGENKANTVDAWEFETDETIYYGTSSDTWSLSLSESDVESSTFGVAFKANVYDPDQCATAQARIDHIQIIVYYTEGSSTPSNIFFWHNF